MPGLIGGLILIAAAAVARADLAGLDEWAARLAGSPADARRVQRFNRIGMVAFAVLGVALVLVGIVDVVDVASDLILAGLGLVVIATGLWVKRRADAMKQFWAEMHSREYLEITFAALPWFLMVFGGLALVFAVNGLLRG